MLEEDTTKNGSENATAGFSVSPIPRWITLLLVALAAFAVITAYMGHVFYSRLANAEKNEKNHVFALTAKLEKANSRVADLEAQANLLTKRQGITQKDLDIARKEAKRVQTERETQEAQLRDNLKRVQQDGEAKIGAVATEVGGARKDIDATRSDLEATKSKLERAVGDENVMSGLIARNREDLEDLKKRGDRNYYEFTLTKSKKLTKIGPIQASLNSVDVKKNKYTMTLLADDKTIQKSDKNADEPVQFYVRESGSRVLYEIVVFETIKDKTGGKVTGYLSTPKYPATQK